MSEAWGTMAWALDFARAARERPRWARALFRIAVGRYAYREFIGLQDELARQSFSPYYGYGRERMNYHHDEVPSDWAAERMAKKI